jgi:hypothetical protein
MIYFYFPHIQNKSKDISIIQLTCASSKENKLKLPHSSSMGTTNTPSKNISTLQSPIINNGYKN